jgi:hypothetical protein
MDGQAMSLEDPRYASFQAIVQIMALASDKDGRDESWRQKPGFFHITKAIRHATTHLMKKMGVTEDDGEDHLKLAITRLAMALTQEKSR